MIELKNIQTVYLVGIGGIGMSALARYFHEKGCMVSGYDRSPSPLTRRLESEGIRITDQSDPNQIDAIPDMVIYTPAVSPENELLQFFRQQHLPLLKRSDALQLIVKEMFCITVAGTHGKTTISTLIAHILRESGYGCNAFLGGIAVNYGTNYWSSNNQVAVIEADEYDRSFLKLEPDIAVLTAMDADHLDIYGTKQAMQDAYVQYTQQIKSEGILIYKYGLERSSELGGKIKTTYGLENKQADCYAENLSIRDGRYHFDVRHVNWTIKNIVLSIGGIHNVENAVAAAAAAVHTGVDPEKIRAALNSFQGVQRRFQYVVHTDQQVYIDDYAHHPEELNMLIASARALFPGKAITLAFQPHLYSRTRDLAGEFARVLDRADEVLLLPIYPAREEPIEGVSSRIIIDKMKNKNARVLSKQDLMDRLNQTKSPLVITAGAGDIDRIVDEIKKLYTASHPAGQTKK